MIKDSFQKPVKINNKQAGADGEVKNLNTETYSPISEESRVAISI